MTNPIKKIIKFIAASGMFVSFAGAITACGGGNDGPTFIDYAHNGSVKLKLDYKNHDFFEDGIGQVTVLTYIDGDTTHFKNVYGDTNTTLKSRYYGIDTPESTGAVQPFGKKASKFTQSKLENAAANGTIVVSSPFSTAADGGPGEYREPETDSTGSRYLSLVWINETVKNAPVESLVLLNLWIVQEGLSWAKNTNEVPSYKDTFSDAQNQAEQFVLGLWQDVDPDFNYGDYATTSLLDIKHEIMASLADPDHKNAFDGAKVRVNGVVGGSCDHMIYIQEYYPVDEDDPSKGGEWAGINIFLGMTAVAESYTRVGTYLEVCANASDSETFGFQLSGTQGHWPTSLEWKEGDDNCKILLTPEQNDGVHALQETEMSLTEVNSLVDDLSSKINNHDETLSFDLYSRVKITTELTCNDAYLNAAGDELTMSFKDAKFRAYLPFNYKGNPNDSGDVWMSYDRVIGKTYSMTGVFSYHKKTSGDIEFQFIVCNANDMVSSTPTNGTTRNEPLSVEGAYEVSFVENVYYYLKGTVEEASDSPISSISSLITIGNALDNGKTTTEVYCASDTVSSIETAWDKGYQNISLTIGSGNNKLVLYRAKVASGVDGSKIAVGKNVVAQGQLKKFAGKVEMVNCVILRYDGSGSYSKDITFTSGDKTVRSVNTLTSSSYADAVIAESIVTVYGVPSVVNGVVTFNGATTMSAKERGQTADDPLTPAQALAIAMKLEEEGEVSKGTYFILGVVKEITSAYDPDTQRISFIIEGDGAEFLISGAKFKSDVNKDDFAVGKTVLVRANFILLDGVYTTRQNGCQIQSIQ